MTRIRFNGRERLRFPSQPGPPDSRARKQPTVLQPVAGDGWTDGRDHVVAFSLVSMVGGAPSAPTEDLRQSVEAALGKRAVQWRKPQTGLTAAQRFVVTADDDTRVFVKAAVDDDTERWLRTDYLVMTHLHDIVPDVLAWTEAGGRPVLVIESLDDAHWPADHFREDGGERKPVWWKPGQLEVLLEALDRLATTAALPSLPPLETAFQPQWPRIAADPEPILALGLVDQRWFERVLSDLQAAEAGLVLRGETLVHNDVRSDNVCFRGNRVVLVDWSDSRCGVAGFDLANLAQTLPLEGGPDPYDIVPDAGAFAAWRAGDLLNRAAGRSGPAPPWLVKVFKRLAVINLDWAAQCLDLRGHAGADWRAI